MNGKLKLAKVLITSAVADAKRAARRARKVEDQKSKELDEAKDRYNVAVNDAVDALDTVKDLEKVERAISR